MNEDFFQWYKDNLFKDYNDKNIESTQKAWAAAAKLMKEKILKILNENLSFYDSTDGCVKAIDMDVFKEIEKL